MSDIPASDQAAGRPEDVVAATSPAPDAPDPAHSPEAAAQGFAEALAKAQAEAADLKDKLLRTLADMENLRRRTEKEVADARTYGVSKFAADMLSVADNIRRALEAAPADADGALKALIDGVALTERDLANKLEQHGVRKVDPKGEKFDPNFHQAMFEAPNPALPNGHVMEVVQVGYRIGDRVLRPALVGVARGGPKAAEPAGPDASASSGAGTTH